MADFFNLETLRFSFGFRFALASLFALATTAQSQHFQPVSVDSPQTTIKFSSHRSMTSILFKLVDGRIFVNVSLEREGHLPLSSILGAMRSSGSLRDLIGGN